MIARARRASWGAFPAAVAALVGLVLLALAGAPPLDATRLLVSGSVGNEVRLGDTLMVWVPLVLAATSLVVTFAAGLWNIGVEGQIVAGAVATAGVARVLDLPPGLLIPAMVLAGAAGGLAWGGLVGFLRVRLGVHEIFGGLGLDFVATGFVIYLVIGPWKRAGIASTSGTAPIPGAAWFDTVGDTRLAPLALVIALVAIAAVALLLRRTRFGLQLRAVGLGPAAAARLGVPTARVLFAAFLIGGAIAGLAGAVQVAAFHHKLVPSVSGGYGFLGILVVLLAGYRLRWTAPIAFFFAAIAVGTMQLQLRLGLHSSLGGVLQGVLVLAAVLASGWRTRRTLRAGGPGAPAAPNAPAPTAAPVSAPPGPPGAT